MTTFCVPAPAEALDVYIELMEDWVQASRLSGNLDMDLVSGNPDISRLSVNPDIGTMSGNEDTAGEFQSLHASFDRRSDPALSAEERPFPGGTRAQGQPAPQLPFRHRKGP